METVDLLKFKGVKINILYNKGSYMRALWQTTFVNDISKSIKKSIYLDSFLWHSFSYEKILCIKEDEARQAFDKIKKSECYIFYQHNDNVLVLDNAEDIKAEDFENEQDVYIVDKDFIWTYVNTHEECCGPYFYKRN